MTLADMVTKQFAIKEFNQAYQQDLATAEMESARLKQQKEQNLAKEEIHLPDKGNVADIYKYNVGETEEG